MFPTFGGFFFKMPLLLEVVLLTCLLRWYNSPNLFGLFALGHISAQALCGAPRPDFLFRPSISIFSTNFISSPCLQEGLGILTRHPSPILTTSPKKMHFLKGLSILGVAFI
jgi:hypothetical protein